VALPETGPGGTCVVTGASSGIGEALARGLARRGRNVTLVARRGEQLRALADELRRDHAVEARAIPVDLTQPDQRAALAEEIEGQGATVELLVNNAGLSTMGPVARSRREAELAMVRTNVEAVVDLCTLLVPGMARRRRGAVLLTASGAAYQPLPGQAGYAASKSFVLSYSWALRAELRVAGVGVTALCPGPVETGFATAAGISDEEAAQSLPKIMWVPAEQVAEAALVGVEHGRAVVIPGPVNRVAAVAGALAPRSVVTSFLARQHPALKRP
jgi:uncharacterized protein